jgi:hypothetical protein
MAVDELWIQGAIFEKRLYSQVFKSALKLVLSAEK